MASGSEASGAPSSSWGSDPGRHQFVAVHVVEQRRYNRLQQAAGLFSATLAVAFVAVSLMSGDPAVQQDVDHGAAHARTELALSSLTQEQTVNKVEEDIPPSFSAEPTGIFTGHSQGKAGGPLTFGKGTYFNVFDPNPHQLTCDPGTFGLGGEDCKECEVNYFCPGGQMKVDCPENTMSLPGSYKKSNCGCKTGYYGQTFEACKACPANSYCPGGPDMNPCPPSSSSPPASFECTCDAGTFGDMAKGCSPCTEGYYCEGGDRLSTCPSHSSAPAGSKNASDCQCSKGYFEPVANTTTAGPDCVTCPANHFCVGGAAALPCPKNTLSPRLSSAQEQCVCAAGFYGTEPTECKPCPKGFFCEGGTSAVACPANSYSAEGASSVDGCVCVPGFVGSSAASCQPCPAGSFCTGGGSVQSCPAHSTSNEGSSKCSCSPGYKGDDPFSCALCAADSFCPGEGKQDPCPPNTQNQGGQSQERHCLCKRGYYGAGGRNCMMCPENSYCPDIGSTPRTCPLHSTAPIGTTKAGECSCKAGFYNARPAALMGHLVGPSCSLCPAGSYCTGDGKATRCPARRSSGAGASSAAACVCASGYYGKPDSCENCPAGSYCEGGTERRDCPVRSMSVARSTKLEQCTCDKGYYGSSPNDCKRCPRNSYCPGGSMVRACPHRSEASEGQVQCTCKPGYYGSNPLYCQPCRAGQYCLGGSHVARCPRYSRSGPNADSIDDCQCVAGWRMVTAENGEKSCVACPAGSYCPGLNKVTKCPAGKDSNPGARSANQCGCTAGYYDGGSVPPSNFAWVFTGKLQIKIPGSYTFCITSDDGSRLFVDGKYSVNNDGLHGTRERCGTVTMTAGMHDMKADGFQAGGGVSMWFKYRGPDTQGQTLYVKAVDGGDKKGGWNLKMYRARYFIRRMPDVNRLYYLGETTLPEINVPVGRNNGLFGTYIEAKCAPCIKGHYCTGAFPTRSWNPRAYLRRCPGAQWTNKKKAVAASECTECRPGYYGSDYRRCRYCPRGSYCPGGSNPVACPAGSWTLHYRRSAVTQCVCKPGFEIKPGGKPHECVPCSKGYYCAGYGGRHRRQCPSGSSNTAGQRYSRTCQCAPGMYGGRGGRCYTCQSRYYCPGNGRRYYCHHRATSARGSTSISQCTCPALSSEFPIVRKGEEPSCAKYHCRTISKCDLQRWCTHDRDCRGFTFPKGVMRGFGCKVRGLKKCLGARKGGQTKDFYEKAASRQPADSVRIMRALRMPIPECPKKGQPATLWQHCNPHRGYGGWRATLYTGNYPYPNTRDCDDDIGLCKVSNCGLRGGDLSSMDIPSNMKVEVYSSTHFRGSKLTLYGPMNADQNCMVKFSLNGRGSWNDRARSVKVMPK